MRVHACGCCRTDLHVVEGDLELAHAADRARAPGRRRGRRARAGCDAARGRRPGRRRVAAPHLTACAGSAAGARRTSASPPTSPAGPSTAATPTQSRCRRLRGPAARRARRSRGGAAPVRGRHRLPRAAAGRGAARRAGRPARLRRVGAPRAPGAAALGLRGGGVDPRRAATASSRVSWARRGSVTPAEPPPEPCDRAVVFAPAGELVPVALRRVAPRRHGQPAGIHMSDVPSFAYELLWHERSLRSVANMTRRDAAGVHGRSPPLPASAPSTRCSPLEDANDALLRSRLTRSAAPPCSRCAESRQPDPEAP